VGERTAGSCAETFEPALRKPLEQINSLARRRMKRMRRTVAAQPLRSDSPGSIADEDPMADTLRSTNDANFDSDVLQATTPVVVDFWATYCQPCKAMVPHLQKIQDDFSDRVKIVQINIEENQAIPTRYKVLKLPTLLMFKNGKVVDQIVGNPGPRKLREFVEKAV
jgi:thioredoxin 1